MNTMRPILEKIILVDFQRPLVKAWERAFADLPEDYPIVEVHHGNYFDYHADAMVSPANSFGYMDGGIDLAISAHIPDIQAKVQAMISRYYHGEMPIGEARVVETDVPEWPYLVVAPTMRIPEKVHLTLNAYWAFRAALFAVMNRGHHLQPSGPIESLLCCGLGTATGGMDPDVCAKQMRYALDRTQPPGVYMHAMRDLHGEHRAMLAGANS